jgi:hypothetical protein
MVKSLIHAPLRNICKKSKIVCNFFRVALSK